MSQDRGHIEHDKFCMTPMNEHTGSESCLVWVDDDLVDEAPVVAHYTQGPQGNQIADYHTDYLAKYGPTPAVAVESGEVDRRDQRDPAELGRRLLMFPDLGNARAVADSGLFEIANCPVFT